MTGKEEQLQERLDVVLALALDRPQAAIPCPQEEELVAWHEEGLAERRREELAAHLASCSSCYLVWSDLAVVTELPQFVKKPIIVKEKRKETSFFAKFAAFLRPGPWAIGGLGTVMATAMLVFILLPTIRMSSLERNLENSFSSLSIPSIGPLLPMQQAQTPEPDYQSKSFTFSPTPQPATSFSWHPDNPQQQAFAVGVAEGMRALGLLDPEDVALYNQLPNAVTMQPSGVSEKAWQRRQKALLYAGRWAVMLKSSCSQPSGLSASFQNDQEGILESLGKEISAYPTRDRYTLFFDSWVTASGAEKDMCGRARALLAMGLGL